MKRRPKRTASTVGFHLISLLLSAMQSDAFVTEAAKKFDLINLIQRGEAMDCKNSTIRFEEPCRCYRLSEVDSTVLDCDQVAFRFFPPMPQNVSLLLASFRDVGYQGLPTELFTGRNSDLEGLDLSRNNLLSINTESFNGLENTLVFLNLSRNKLGTNFQPQLEITEVGTLLWLEVMDLSSNEIKSLSSAMFDGLKRLQELYLGDNLLMDGQSFSFGALPNLKLLDLTENRLFRLESQGFARLPSLLILLLEDNFITQIMPGAFNGTKLSECGLARNRISILESLSFSGVFSSLEVLDLSFNALKNFPDFGKLKVLKTLNLSANVLQGKPMVEETLPTSLLTLDLSGNLLTAVNLLKLPLLQHLHLSRNFLDHLLTSLLPLSQLYTLDLRSTNMTVVSPELLQNSTNLRWLDLSYNRLHSLPENSFNHNDKLVQLYLNNCGLRNLSSPLFLPLKRLKILDLSGNGVDDFNPMFVSSQLTHLDLARNRISAIRNFSRSLLNLVVINLSGNMMQELDFSLFPMCSLASLNMSRNRLQHFPVSGDVPLNCDGPVRLMTLWDRKESTGGHESRGLKKLDLSWNKIQKIDQKLTWFLTNLEEIDLAHNKISTVAPFIFSNLVKIRKIDLSGNVLSDVVDGSFARLPALRVLELHGNQLKVLTNQSFEFLPLLNYLDLSRNRLASVQVNPDLGDFRGLQFLDLSSNLFTDLSAISLFVPSLVSVILCHNQLTHFSNMTFGKMPNLRVMKLQYNNISVLSSNAFANMSQLQELQLNRNRLRAIPANLFRDLRRLALNLEDNFLDELDENLFSKDKIDRLEYLNLDRNNFTKFPTEAIAEQDFNLITLTMAGNRIRDVPPGLLVNIKDLNLASNPLSINSTNLLLTQPKLTFSLNLANLGLSTFPALQLQFLSSLNLSNNRLTSCGQPTSWDRGTLLQNLDLSKNWITDMAESGLKYILPKLVYLKALNLSGNPLRHIRQKEISGLINLETLYLTDLNRLETFDVSNFLELPRLKNLAASGYPRLVNFPLEDIAFQLVPLHYLAIEIRNKRLSDQVHMFYTPALTALEISGRNVKEISGSAFTGISPPQMVLKLADLAVNSVTGDLFRDFSRATKLKLVITGTEIADFGRLLGEISVEDPQYYFEKNRLECACTPEQQFSLWKRIADSSGDVKCDAPSELAGTSVRNTSLPTECRDSGFAIDSLSDKKLQTTSQGIPLEEPLGRLKTTDSEPEVIYEITTVKPVPSPIGYRLEGLVAGIVVALILLILGLIIGILYWHRHEKRRLRKTLTLDPTGPPKTEYSVMENPDIIPHPTWYPPPLPVFVVPYSSGSPIINFHPGRVGFYEASDSTPTVDYYDTSLENPPSESDYTYASTPEGEWESRATYSLEESMTTDGPLSEDYYPDDDAGSADFRR